MADDTVTWTQSSYRERMREPHSCEICFTPIPHGYDLCARCDNNEKDREHYRESMIDAGRGHLLG